MTNAAEWLSIAFMHMHTINLAAAFLGGALALQPLSALALPISEGDRICRAEEGIVWVRPAEQRQPADRSILLLQRLQGPVEHEILLTPDQLNKRPEQNGPCAHLFAPRRQP